MRMLVEGLDRITFDPSIMQGQACIRGMRIPVSLVVNLVAHGKSAAQILEEYPALEPADITQALEYAALLTRDEVLVQQVGPVRFLADMGLSTQTVPGPLTSVSVFL